MAVLAFTRVSAAGSELYLDFNAANGGDGSSNQPFNKLIDAVSNASAGDTILVKPGTYAITPSQAENSGYLSIQGFKPSKASCDARTPETMVTIKPAPGGNVVIKPTANFGWRQFLRIGDARCINFDGDNRTTIDGAGFNFDDNISLVYIYESENIIFENTVVQNGKGRGISYYNTNNGRDDVYIRGNTVTGIHYRTIGGYGDYNYIEDNDVYNNALANENGKISGSGWPGVIQTTNDYQTLEYSNNVFIRGNHVHDNWGEGIITNFVNGAEITGNTVANNYSINIYLDNGSDVLVSGNYIYNDTNKFERPDRRGVTASGITWTSENYGGYPPTILPENLTIENNLIVGGRYGLSYIHAWRGGNDNLNSYKNIWIRHNTIKDSEVMPILMEATRNTQTPSGNRLQNNLIFKGNSQNCNNYDSNMVGNFATYCIGNNDFNSWTVGGNYWVETNNSNDPMLAGGNLSAGQDPTSFVPKVDSPVAYGANNVGVSTDYFGNPRGNSGKTAGFAEPASTTTSSSSSSSMACIGDYNFDGAVEIQDFSVFASNYRKDNIVCSLDLINNDCYLNLNDLSVFAQQYKNPGACQNAQI